MGSERSQSMVEFVLVLPIFLVLVMGIIDFGMGFGAYVQLKNAAREGARYAVVGNPAGTYPADCTGSVTTSVIGHVCIAVNDLKLASNLRLGWKLNARYTDCQDPGPYYAVVLPRTFICDQTLSLKIRDARIYYRVDNLFNAEYQTRYGYPMPRRSYAFGISMELWD